MDYENYFSAMVNGLKTEGRYRIFADLERRAGNFPKANFHYNGTAKEVIPTDDDMDYLIEAVRKVWIDLDLKFAA